MIVRLPAKLPTYQRQPAPSVRCYFLRFQR